MQLSAGFHQHKLAQVREELGNQGLDGLLVMNPVNVYYLTGFWHTPAGVMERPAFVLVPQTGEPTLMVSLDVYGHRGADLSPVVDDIRAYSEYPFTGGQSTLDWACREIEGAGLEGMILGVEDNFTPLNDGLCQPWFQHIADTFQGRVVPAGTLVNRMRMIKGPEEITMVRRACHYADELMRVTSEAIREGCSERAVGLESRNKVEASMRAELEVVVPSLGNGHILAGTPRGSHDTADQSPERTLRRRVPIIINCFAVVGGYHGESERCGLLGEPTRRQKYLFDVAMESQSRAVEVIRPGVRCHEVDLAGRQVVEGAGFDYLYGVGHGIGLLGHEPPWVREGSQTTLETGMCVTVEPGLGVPGEGSFHCSQTVLVTEDGCEPLTIADGIHRLDLP